MSTTKPMDIDDAIETQEDSKATLAPEIADAVQSPLPERDVDYDSDTPPTAEAWKKMKGYGSFITHDQADEEHIFHVNDIIYVLPTGRDPDQDIDKTELWLAQIRSIRAHDSESVWVRAKWFYHPAEIPKNIKGADVKLQSFGTFERINSNQADFIPTSTCCGLAEVVEYDEQNAEQEDIEYGVFYYRCNYDWQKRSFKRPSPPCSICKRPYNPDTDTMHFCPRPRCRRAWHASCLANANWVFTSPVDIPRRLESLDDARGSSVLTDIPKSSPPKKVRAVKSEKTRALDDPYARIPADLIAVARQPIVRGESMGVVGNVRSVVRARTMVQNALKGIESVPEDWANKLGKVYDVSAIGSSIGAGKTKRKGKVLAYQCPQCGEPI